MATVPQEGKISSLPSYTIAMLSQALVSIEESSFQGKPIDVVEVLAKIKEMRETALRYEFILVDSTASLTAFAYKKNTGSDQKLFKNFEFYDNSYALAHGTIRKSADKPSFIITHLQNVATRTTVDDFLSRVLVGYIKNYAPKLSNEEVHQEIVLKALRNLKFNIKGYTATNLKDAITEKLEIDDIDNALTELLMKGILKNGADWNHYLVIK